MRIRDLGPLVVELDGTVTELGGTKQAALLGLLAVNANRAVSARALMLAAWGPDAEVSLSSLDSQLWRLRNVLEPGRGRSSSVLVRDGNSYRLRVDPDAVDSVRFERLASRAGEALAGRDAVAAAPMIEEALALWRSSPDEPLGRDGEAAPMIKRLDEIRSQLMERRIDALLDLGADERALADLEPLLVRTPYREHLWRQRMLALSRLGRTEEALATYARVRSLLSDELGLDPGAELQEMHARILAADAPVPRVRPVAAPPPAPPAEVHLPQRRTALIGRGPDLARLQALVLGQPLVTICGPGGSGKTRLSVEVAAAAAAGFPDGVWFVDLAAATDAQLVVDVVVSTLALGATRVVDPLPALADFARGRRMLVVLDNCEHVLDGVARVVETLLGAGPGDPEPGPTVLTTSREPLDLDGEHIWTLAPLSLRAEDASDAGSAPALRLFLERARAAHPEVELGPDQLGLAVEICQALDGLPLAIELAAARVRSFSLAEIAEQARADPSRLSRVGRARGDHRQSLFEAIEWSYRLLDPREKTLHRYLSVLPGPFTLSAATGVAAGMGADPYEIADGLLGLAHRSLLTVGQTARGRTTSSFAQLETVRSHASRQLVAEGEATDVLARRDQWVRSLLARRPRLGHPEAPVWYDELEECYPAVRAVLQRAARPDGDAELVALGSGLGFFWYFRSRMIEGCRWLEKAQAAGLQPVDSAEDLALRLRLAAAFMLRFRPDLAREHLPADLGRLSGSSRESSVLLAEAMVSAAGGAWACRAFDLVGSLAEQLGRLAAEIDDVHVRLFADIIGCVASLPLGRFAETGARAETLYARSVELENLHGGWLAALVRCVVASETANRSDALAWTRRVVDVHARLGGGGSQVFLESLANCFAVAGDFEGAVRVYSASQTQARRAGSGWPEHPKTRELFARARAGLPAAAFDRVWHDGAHRSVADLVEALDRAG